MTDRLDLPMSVGRLNGPSLNPLPNNSHKLDITCWQYIHFDYAVCERYRELSV
ncbi:hypothetical protein Pan54_10560 [Rubinisphaera italica]|uniref:Uncharacterized protein n=1 Tax=Rubinisphaera italica TaxID=2527969 RepID=A0A5C5XEJ8_9PLAN|nr:hypothetical protein Pan54_10560 [Rubinisphaera italica]